MKTKKRSNLYDPNLIWACSFDLREEPTQVSQIKRDTEITSENILPPNTKLDLDNSEERRIN